MSSDEPNKDVAYEKLVQEIYQTLLDSEDIKPIKVQHNIDIIGRSGCKHQIDVYWEYEIAGVLNRVAIECKNYNTSNIPIGRIRDFFGALNDIGNVNGIFVCKNGYQSGAIRFADFYGINLKELRVPTESDWEGRIKKIRFNISIVGIDVKLRLPEYDSNWLKEKFPNIQENQNLEVSGLANEILIKDKNGNRITDLKELEDKLPHEFNEETSKEYIYKWDDAYIDVTGFGAIKILSFKYVYDIRMTKPKEVIISGADTAKAILKDVKTGEIKFFKKEGSI